jgi:diguanylate cyclase (GGDEF)-like protein
MLFGLLAALNPAVAAPDGCPPLAQRQQLSAAAKSSDARDLVATRQRWEDLLAALRACADVPAEASAYADWSKQLVEVQAGDEALDVENARYALAARANLPWHQAEAALRLGILLTMRGERDLAERRLREASVGFEQLRAWSEAADAQSRLSRLNRGAGDYLAALTDEQQALALRRRIDPPPNVWRSLLNLAVLYEQLELPEDARRRYAESLDEAEREGVEANVTVVLSSFAGFLNDFGAADAAQALAMAERALGNARRGQSVVQVSSSLLQVGRAQLNLGHLDAADRALQEGYDLALGADHEALQAHLLLRHGELAQAQGRLTLALQRVDAARLLYEAQGNRHRLVKVHAALEQIHEALGDPLSAVRSGRERFRLRDELVGAKATGKLGELLSRFELSEERRRSERLEQEKAVAELRLVSEGQRLRSIYLVAAAIALALLLLIWRHLTARRLYRLLHGQNQVMQAQAEQLTLANQKLTEQSERLYRASITDGLTGVNNRAHGMQRLQALVQARATGQRPALVLIDVDHFKAINDTHGHPVGDQVLVTIARLLQQAMPADADLSRVGGEEFMVLLPDTSSRQALDIADALRAQVRTAAIDVDGHHLQVTISIGLCLLAFLDDPAAHAAYSAADAALYEAKRGGRDCVRSWSATTVAAG